MDSNWLEVICTQVMCDDMSDWMYAVYVLRSKLPTYFLSGVYPIHITWWIHACGQGMHQSLIMYILYECIQKCIHVFIIYKFINII